MSKIEAWGWLLIAIALYAAILPIMGVCAVLDGREK